MKPPLKNLKIPKPYTKFASLDQEATDRILATIINRESLNITKAAYTLHDNAKLTIANIMKNLNLETLPGKKFKRKYDEIYNFLSEAQYLGFYLWTFYTDPASNSSYREDYKEVEYYIDTSDNWEDNFFRNLYDSGIYTRAEMENAIIQAHLFEGFVKSLRKRNIPFFVAGRGKKFYRIPNYYDFCSYKLKNLRTPIKQAISNVEDFAQAKLLLPSGHPLPSLPILKDLPMIESDEDE